MVKKVISDELLDLMIADLELYKKRGIDDPWILTDGTRVEPVDVLQELRERRENPDTDTVTRFEVIDWRDNIEKGRIVVEHDVGVKLNLQDDNRTLKVFLTEGKSK